MKQLLKTLGGNIDHLYKLTQDIKKLNEQIKEIKEEKTSFEYAIKDMLYEQGLEKSSGKKASVSITKMDLPTIVDIDKFNLYVRRNHAYYLYPKKILSTAYRDELDARNGRLIPGVETFTKESLGCRKK